MIGQYQSSTMTFRMFALSLCLFAAIGSALRAGEPKLSKAEVIRLAIDAAQNKGFRLNEFEPPVAKHELVRKDDTWWVFFQGKVHAPDNFFSVSIHDKTKKVSVLRGG